MQLSMLPPALLALLPLASAAGYSYGAGTETTSASSSSSTSSSSSSQQAQDGVTIINVGKNGLVMEPNDVTVPSGQTIEFHFYSGSHSVAQSAFDSPCTPLNTTQGFFSGPQPASQGSEAPNVFRVVSTGSPMWYYCATGRHCQSGMVGVINKPSNGQKTIQMYASTAAKAAQNVAPKSVAGGEVASSSTSGSGNSNSGSGTSGSGSGTATGGVTSQPTTTRVPGAGVDTLNGLSMPLLGVAAVAAVLAAM